MTPADAPTRTAPHTGSAREIPNLLSVAGTDPTGGAGIHADLKSFAAHRTYGMAAVTALVAQNTGGVRAIHVPEAGFLAAQLASVTDDVAVDGVKIGMLGTVEVIETVAAWWDGLWTGRAVRPALVLDPVMVATSGDRLLDAEAESALLAFLCRADLITPNVPELALLADREPAGDAETLIAQARVVADAHSVLVLAKGGHLDADDVVDVLVHPTVDGVRPPEHRAAGPRVETTSTHGTGCSVSAALAALRARGLSWEEAVDEVKVWMTEALRDAERLDVGVGHGPIQHFAQLWR